MVAVYLHYYLRYTYMFRLSNNSHLIEHKGDDEPYDERIF